MCGRVLRNFNVCTEACKRANGKYLHNVELYFSNKKSTVKMEVFICFILKI